MSPRRLLRASVAVLVAAVVLVVVGPGIFTPVGHRLAIAERPSAYGLSYEDVAFAPRDRAITLRGWWIAAAHPRAALVTVHGGGDDNRSMPYLHGLALARDLVAHGYALLMIDLRNFGESDGAPEGLTYGDLEANDVIGAVDYLAVRAPQLPVGALGCSMGGATALRAAARDRRLRAVVADSAFAEAGGVAAAFTRAATGMPLFLATPFVWSARYLHGLPLGRGATVDEVRRAAMPAVLLIHDAHDPIVPAGDTDHLVAAIPRAVTWTTNLDRPGPFGTHCMAYPLAPEAYVGRVSAFLDEALVDRHDGNH